LKQIHHLKLDFLVFELLDVAFALSDKVKKVIESDKNHGYVVG